MNLNGKTNKRKGRAFLCLLIAGLLLGLLWTALRGPIKRMYYPLAYQDLIAAASEEFGVPEDLLCGVIWCESHFRPDAQSSAGACGLMQMTPATFGEVLWRLDLPEDTDIFAPEQNIRCGAFYLHRLYTLYDENWDTALAAYNAGMGNVNNWLADPRYSADGETLQKIPFSETAAYVEKVQEVKDVYRELYPDEIQ